MYSYFSINPESCIVFSGRDRGGTELRTIKNSWEQLRTVKYE